MISSFGAILALSSAAAATTTFAKAIPICLPVTLVTQKIETTRAKITQNTILGL